MIGWSFRWRKLGLSCSRWVAGGLPTIRVALHAHGVRWSGRGRGCVKTLPPSNFGGRLTLGEVEKIAPSAIWRLDISSHVKRSAFSHNLGRKCAFVASLEPAALAALLRPKIPSRTTATGSRAVILMAYAAATSATALSVPLTSGTKHRGPLSRRGGIAEPLRSPG